MRGYGNVGVNSQSTLALNEVEGTSRRTNSHSAAEGAEFHPPKTTMRSVPDVRAEATTVMVTSPPTVDDRRVCHTPDLYKEQCARESPRKHFDLFSILAAAERCRLVAVAVAVA